MTTRRTAIRNAIATAIATPANEPQAARDAALADMDEELALNDPHADELLGTTVVVDIDPADDDVDLDDEYYDTEFFDADEDDYYDDNGTARRRRKSDPLDLEKEESNDDFDLGTLLD